MHKWIITISIMGLLFLSCSKDETTPVTTETEVTIKSTNYILETVHSSFFGENENKFYRSVTLSIEFDQSKFLNNIKKIIIFNSFNGNGWEFTNQELQKYVDESLNGVLLNHLILPDGLNDSKYTISIYNFENDILDEYEFLLKSDFPSSLNIKHNWIDNNRILLNTEFYYSSNLPDTFKIIYLNEQEIIGEYSFTSSVNANKIENVPNIANSFYVEGIFNSAQYQKVSISKIQMLNEKIPQDAILFPENISVDISVLSVDNTNFIFYSEADSRIYFWNINQHSVTSFIELPSKATSLKLDNNDIYVGLESGSLYKIDQANELQFLKNFGGQINDFLNIGDYIVLSVNYEEIWIYNKINSTATKYENYFIYNLNALTYNSSLNVIYGITTSVAPSDMHRMNFNPISGIITDYKDSRYHGDYYFGNKIAVFPSFEKIITSSGNIFSCSNNYVDDIVYVASLNNYFKDLVFTETNDIITIYSNETNYSDPEYGILNVYNATTTELERSYALYELPFEMHELITEYMIVSKISTSNRYFYQIFSKNEFNSKLFEKISNSYKKQNL